MILLLCKVFIALRIETIILFFKVESKGYSFLFSSEIGKNNLLITNFDSELSSIFD